jgi:hypothetical protein
MTVSLADCSAIMSEHTNEGAVIICVMENYFWLGLWKKNQNSLKKSFLKFGGLKMRFAR